MAFVNKVLWSLTVVQQPGIFTTSPVTEKPLQIPVRYSGQRDLWKDLKPEPSPTHTHQNPESTFRESLTLIAQAPLL